MVRLEVQSARLPPLASSPSTISVTTQASLIKLLKEDRRRKKMSSDKVKMEDTLRDIQENPAKFAMASSLTDDRSWLHFAAQQASIPAVKALIENGADVNARDLVSVPCCVRGLKD